MRIAELLRVGERKPQYWPIAGSGADTPTTRVRTRAAEPPESCLVHLRHESPSRYTNKQQDQIYRISLQGATPASTLTWPYLSCPILSLSLSVFLHLCSLHVSCRCAKKSGSKVKIRPISRPKKKITACRQEKTRTGATSTALGASDATWKTEKGSTDQR
ncbi:hypothetical protein BJY01DRAFT_163560 [Aspergillus pseudoustus]|uniref:Uncharacterized protein n=1 Tax=Aspergillus pseudoustus TaxID=1810923 RepID=A0ABR4IAR6_9EURO